MARVGRIIIFAIVGLFAALPVVADAQAALAPPCDMPRGRGDYIACALKAGNVPDLRNTPMRDGERGLRFWTVSGNMIPERVLVSRRRLGVHRCDRGGGQRHLYRRHDNVDPTIV